MALLLRIMTTAIGLVAVLTGAGAIFFGKASPLFAPTPEDHVVLDNMIRFYAGIWMGLGFAGLWVSTRIEKEPALFRAFWWMVFFGGLARIVSVVTVGSPGPILLAVMGSELFSLVLLYLHRRTFPKASTV